MLNVIMTKPSYVFTANLHNCCFIYIHQMVRAKPNPTYNKVFSDNSSFSAENEIEHGKYSYTNTISCYALYEQLHTTFIEALRSHLQRSSQSLQRGSKFCISLKANKRRRPGRLTCMNAFSPFTLQKI